MSSKVLSFKVDEHLKSDFVKLSQDLGMPVSAMFTVFMKKAISENGLPFDVKRKQSDWDMLVNKVYSETPVVKLNPKDENSTRSFFDD